MKVIITGGTGFIGTYLVPELVEAGHEVVVLTRSPDKARGRVHEGADVAGWDPTAAGDWQSIVDGADAVIHLAGKGVLDDRWTDEVREAILASRVDTTALIVEAIAAASDKPSVLISGSAVGYYGHADEAVDEDSPPAGDDDFLAKVCKAWEAASHPVDDLGVRRVNVRIGVVLGTDGGALPEMARPMKFFAGGPLGSGEQRLPWVHISDTVGMIVWALDNQEVKGPLNVTAPSPPKLKDFMKALGSALGRPSWLPAPSFAIKLALGDRAAVLLTGQNAIPKKAQSLGYSFRFGDLDAALADLVAKM